MEKQRNKRLIKSCRRFLIILLALFSPILASAQNLSLDQIKALRITAEEGQNLYTKTDLKFTVTIPNVHSSQVQILSTEQKSDINFRTIRKSENYGENGTTIEIWYNFEKKGTYTLTPLSVLIQNRKRNISFETITVTDDPATMLPRIVIVFEDGTEVVCPCQRRSTDKVVTVDKAHDVSFNVICRCTTFKPGIRLIIRSISRI